MRLVDGQVMDFVKGSGPYVDERFGQPNLLTGQTADVTAEAPTQQTLAPTVGTFREPGQLLSDEVVAAEMERMSHDFTAPLQSAVSQWNNIPQPPLQPALNNLPFPSYPQWTQHTQMSMPNDMIALRARVQARIDTLESLDDKTPEMNATIKALKWVVEDIAKNTVTFTNSDRTIP